MDLEPGLLRRLLDAARAAIVAVDSAGAITYWSPAAEELYGYPAAEVVGRSIRQVLVTPDQAWTAADIMARVRRGEAWSGAFPVRRRDGTILTVQVSDAPVFDDEGRVIGAVGVSIDISDRVRAHAALRREQDLLRSTIDNVPIVLFATDTDGTFTVSRGRALTALGLREDEVLGRSALEIYGGLTISAGRETMSFAEAMRRVLAGEVIAAHTTVGPVHFDLWLAPQRDAEGRLTGVVGVALDVTSRSDLEQRLQQAQKLEALGLLAGGVAHDFNNLLTAILGHAEILAADLSDDGLRPDVQAIRHAAESAASVTKQLLAFTRRQHQELRPIDVNQAVLALEQLLRRTLGEQIQLDLRLTQSPTVVMADSTQIEQVILNLAINARDAMPTGGRLTISTAVIDHADDSVELSVADTGHGIDAEIRGRIFEPFFTTKERGRGTGLGLASVHGIVAQTGGEIFVESEEGSGTVFRVVLPRARDQHPTRGAAAPAPVAGHRPHTVLVAEDDSSVRDLVATMLTREGYRVVSHAAPADALTAMRASPHAFDLLLTDLVMPDMTGHELAIEVLAIRPSIPIVYMSGYVDADVLGTGPEPDLQKPFTREQLLACIQRRLG